MSKSRVVILILTSGLLYFFSSLSAPSEQSGLLTSWSLCLAMAGFAVAVSAWRGVRMLLVLSAIGSCGVSANALTDPLTIGLVAVATAAGLWALMRGWAAAPQWVKRSKYDSPPENPWNAIDQGVDPTQ